MEEGVGEAPDSTGGSSCEGFPVVRTWQCGLGLGPGPQLFLQDILAWTAPGREEVNQPIQHSSIPINEVRNEMQQQPFRYCKLGILTDHLSP